MLQDPLHVDPTVDVILKVGSGIFWSLTYLLILRRGFLDKSYGMPVVALCANLSWEFIFSFVHPHSKPQLYIDYAWLALDAGILVQYLTYGRKAFPKHLPGSLFYPTFLLTLLLSFLFILLLSRELNDLNGVYAAFSQNLLMSILFVQLLLKRNSHEGQSIYIALCKMIGTVFPSILLYLYFPHSYFLNLLYVSIFIFDITYLLLLYFKIRAAGLSPWARL
ncbi:transmembrane-type terpene cyclase [Pontibacter chinhatensis]|uniref:Uncharacterized protein n=1 Tax=Pontibacter chinhatensis TaxID=1436961 RepID=A0A1I2Y700_9BACT|nr:hypothetical protein [Pontibacter chinhatensis]SFH21514.1 hypothetical protein SAMN05421739_107107 [Pontibacter chinhatensis]